MRKPRRSYRRSPLARFEALEGRRMLATDLGQITGVVENDLENDGVDDVVAVGQQLELFLDDGDGVFDAGDASQGTTTTAADGSYSFDNLVAGDYFVRVNPTAGTQTRTNENVSSLISFSAADAMGSTNITIDDFSNALTLPAATLGSDQSGTVDAVAIAGGEQDLFAQVTAGAGNITAQSGFVNSAARSVLSLSSGSGVNGRLIASWDGNDNDGANLAQGLGLDISQSGVNSAFAINLSADQTDGTLLLRAYSGAGNVSTATIELNNLDGGADNGTADDVETEGIIDGDAEEQISVNFTDFATTSGSGADFSNVTAFELELDFTGVGENGLDAEIEVLGVVGFTTRTADFTVLNEMSLGDQVWLDLDNDGQFEVGESGIQNVAITLFEDSNGDDSITGETQVGTTTTDANGNYSFTGLLPGDYLVRIDASNFTGGGALEGLATSTGNDVAAMAPDPDTPTANDTDKGTVQGDSSVLSKGVTLVGNDETGDGDVDANSNDTLDFGFFGYDLTITKDVDQSTAFPNDALVYTITVTNAGPTNATGVTLTDTLPTGVTFVSGLTTVAGETVNGSAGSSTVTSTIGTLLPSQSATITINATIDPSATGTLTNTATTAGVDEADNSNNTATAATTITPRVDLAITKADDDLGAAVEPGDTVTYTVNVTNNGPSDATGVVVTDTLPAGLTFVSAGSTTPTSNVPGVGGTTVLTYNLGALGSGASATPITIVTTVDSGTNGTVVNNTSVTATEGETTLLNNDASASSVVTPPTVDLVITKVDDDGDVPVLEGQTITYTLNVTNNGPSDATGVTVTDTLPTGLTFVSAGSTTPTSSSSVAQGTQLTYTVGSLASGASATPITIVATVDAGLSSAVTNTAEVTGNEMETNSLNNTATAASTPAVGSITGKVFVDNDADDVQDTGDIPIAGVVITLVDSVGAQVATTTTDSSGCYEFTGLTPGMYRVVQTQPTAPFSTLDETSPDAGADTSVSNQISNITVLGNAVSPANNFTESLDLTKRTFFWSSGAFT